MNTSVVALADEARRVGMDVSQARRMARRGRIVARLVGRDWLCQPGALDKLPRRKTKA